MDKLSLSVYLQQVKKPLDKEMCDFIEEKVNAYHTAQLKSLREKVEGLERMHSLHGEDKDVVYYDEVLSLIDDMMKEEK